MLKSIVLTLIIFLSIQFGSFAQKSLLQSGPMLGYSEMQEVMLWVQTKQAAEVHFVYQIKDESQPPRRTEKIMTSKSTAFTAHLKADSVQPGNHYSYHLYINDILVQLPYPLEFQTQQIWKWRGDPPNFSMLTSSCAYVNQTEHDRPGKPYGGDYRIFSSMNTHKAEFMVWLGDNIYLREPDWNSTTGIHARYTHTRSIAELQPFLSSTHHYAIWDDHDYGPNDSDKGFFNKNATLEAFKYFWGNPTYGVGDIKGVTTAFQWGDADFFLLDNRWYRDPDKIEKSGKTVLGQQQLEWLLNNLVTSTATFKIVAMGGQFLSTAAEYEIYSANGYDKERQLIIDFIHRHAIKNVVFITGDVHFSEMSVLKETEKPTIYDLTFSTMTAGSNTQGGEWKNTLRVPGTVVIKRNFGKISFRGALKKRELVVQCFDTDNIMQWEQIIQQE